MRTKLTGFTLLEISLVLVIAGLLATTVVVFAANRHRRIDQEAWLSQFKHWEDQTRARARRSHRACQLVVQTETGSCRFVDEKTQEPVDGGLELPATLALHAIRLQGQTEKKGQIAIPYSSSGYSPTYALQLIDQKATTWLIVAGLTGQVIQTDSPGAVDAIMAPLQ
jgi:prepilin-type N-terminal cleavage/methylation domain-containing protein